MKMKLKLKDLKLIASMLPFFILLCAIEMGGCVDSSDCYDRWVGNVKYQKDIALKEKDNAKTALANMKTSSTCEDKLKFAKQVKEAAQKAKNAATIANSTPTKD